jgi:hypothetical protein
MTFVFTVFSRNTLWVAVDRRLSYGSLRPPVDDAIKIMGLTTNDGNGILAYAGLGATPKGTQPSEWMSAVLRGRGGLTFDQTLGVLAGAATRELPKYLVDVPGGGHFIVAPAFVKGIGSRLYSIESVVHSKTKQHWFRYTHHLRDVPSTPSVRIAFAGSGGYYLAQKDRLDRRSLFSLVKKHDSGKVSSQFVADRLAKLNYETHKAMEAAGDRTVGPRCIVVWRRRPGLRGRDTRGGGHLFYTGVDRERDCPSIPSVGSGMDTQALVEILFKQFRRNLADHGFNPAAFDVDEMNRLVAGIPNQPDERLR